jgi:hypothetical protein
MGMMNALVEGKRKSTEQNSTLFGGPAAKLKNAEGNVYSNAKTNNRHIQN